MYVFCYPQLLLHFRFVQPFRFFSADFRSANSFLVFRASRKDRICLAASLRPLLFLCTYSLRTPSISIVPSLSASMWQAVLSPVRMCDSYLELTREVACGSIAAILSQFSKSRRQFLANVALSTSMATERSFCIDRAFIALVMLPFCHQFIITLT